MTINEFKSQNLKKIETASTSPALDLEVLLQFCLKCTKTQILLNKNQELTKTQEEWLNQAVEKRKAGLPVAYITGEKEFFGYSFQVSPSVLIPKPDTEILVENAVQLLVEKIDLNPGKILTVCDMCTGSGCIAISVLKALSENENIPLEKLPKFTLVDISKKALETAEKNAEKLLTKEELSKVRFVQSNLFEQLPFAFDVVLTNPPYVPSSIVDQLLADGRSEPRLALDGDITITGDKSFSSDGLEIIRNLMPQIYAHLVSQGFFLMETGEYNMDEAESLAQDFNFSSLEVIKDLEGQKRVLYGVKFEV